MQLSLVFTISLTLLFWRLVAPKKAPKYMPGDSHPLAGAFDATHELLEAAERGKAHRINQVLDHGAAINARNNNGVR